MEVATLKTKLCEQSQIIYESKQKLYNLGNENLHLKSCIDDLETEVFLKNKVTIASDLTRNNDDSSPASNFHSNVNVSSTIGLQDQLYPITNINTSEPQNQEQPTTNATGVQNRQQPVTNTTELQNIRYK